MKTVRMIFSLLRRVINHDGDWRRDRVERTPVVEPMEPRALLSGMEPTGAIVVPPHHAGAELVIPMHQPSSFHVLYQPIHIGELSATGGHASVETASTAQQTSAQTMNLTPEDDTDDDDDGDDDGDADDDDGDGDDDDGDDDDGDGDGDGDGDDDGDDNDGDEIDDENDP